MGKFAFVTWLVVAVAALGAAPSSQQCADGKRKVVCYYSSWAIYRERNMGLAAEKIDPHICTHLVYSFAGLDVVGNAMQSLDPQVDFEKGQFMSFIRLKEKNPCLKTILAIGGWNERPIKYSVMANTAESRLKFADNALRFVVNHGFDGIDVDWEYPTARGGIPADKQNFVELLKQLKDKFAPWGLEVTVAVAQGKAISTEAYLFEEICASVDFVSIMAYDYTSSNSNFTGLLAPLTGPESIETTLSMWSKCDQSKLVLGIPAYARGFILEKSSNSSIGAKTLGPCPPGEFTQESGYLSKFELETVLAQSKAYKIDCSTASTCYATNGTLWYSFDNDESIAKKVKWAKEKNLGGLMVWTADVDDFLGVFSETPYPIIRAVRKILD